MFSNGTNYSLSDIAAVTRNQEDGFLGMGNSGWIWIILIFFLFGWGGYGNGFGRNGVDSAGLQGMATRADINEGFAFNNLQRNVDAIHNGICDSTYELNNAITNGFYSVDKGLCNVGNMIQQCCCETSKQIADVNYNLASQSCETRQAINNVARDITDNANANTRAILDFLTTDKISTLQAQNAALTTQLSQISQTNSIVSQLKTPAPIPAYITCSPYQSQMFYAGCGQTCGCAC